MTRQVIMPPCFHLWQRARNSVHREHLLKRYFVLLFIRAILLIKNEIENGFQKKKESKLQYLDRLKDNLHDLIINLSINNELTDLTSFAKQISFGFARFSFGKTAIRFLPPSLGRAAGFSTLVRPRTERYTPVSRRFVGAPMLFY